MSLVEKRYMLYVTERSHLLRSSGAQYSTASKYLKMVHALAHDRLSLTKATPDGCAVPPTLRRNLTSAFIKNSACDDPFPRSGLPFVLWVEDRSPRQPKCLELPVALVRVASYAAGTVPSPFTGQTCSGVHRHPTPY
jgi:hypothetical protein